MRAVVLIAALALGGCASLGLGLKDGPAAAVESGRALASARCARCHALDGSGPRGSAAAPTFAAIRSGYSAPALLRELEAIATVGHYQMPPIPLRKDEIESLVAYLGRPNARSSAPA